MFSAPDEAGRGWGDLFFPVDSVGGGPEIRGPADKKAGARPDNRLEVLIGASGVALPSLAVV